MRQVFTIIKLLVVILTFGGTLDVILSMYDVPSYFYPTFGNSIASLASLLWISYSRIGKTYFTKYFRISIILIAIPMIIEQIDMFVLFINNSNYYNFTAALILTAFISSIISLVASKKQDDEPRNTKPHKRLEKDKQTD